MTVSEERYEQGAEEQQNLPFQHFEYTNVQKIHHFYISTDIGDPHLYIPMIQILQTSTENDIIFIHINTLGGSLSTGIQIINAMRSSEAHIITSIESELYSMGTFLFLAGDEFRIHKNCMMMLHNFSSTTFGKGHEQKSHLEATERWFRDLTNELYLPFLSEDELNRMFGGEDFYFHSEEIAERLTKVMESKVEKVEVDTEKVDSVD